MSAMSPFPPGPDEGVALAMALAPFHVAVLEYRVRPDGAETIRAMLPSVTLLGLGNLVAPGGPPAPARSTADAQGEQTITLIHFIADGVEYLPLWSDPNALMHAGQVNPDWGRLQPLVLTGKGLAEALSPQAWIVINPWTELELSIPPRAGGG